MKPNKTAYELYAITAPSPNLVTQVREAIAGGITMLQIREKNCTTKRLIELAYPIVTLCRNEGIPCIIDNDVEAAKILNADGVHIGQKDMKVAKAREILGDSVIIGTSAHTVKEAILAEEQGADYLGCGAVFPTKSKPDTTHLSLLTLSEIRKSVSIPIVAIGGVSLENISQLYPTGLDGVAVVSAVFGQPDTKKAVEILRTATAPFGEKERNL